MTGRGDDTLRDLGFIRRKEIAGFEMPPPGALSQASLTTEMRRRNTNPAIQI